VANRPLILFDGVCNFCNASVAFIIKRDPEGVFKFAPLQSDAGQVLLRKFSLSTTDLDTMVLIEDDRAFTRSTAGLRIARHLKWPWPLSYAFIAVPKFLRDAVYRFIARNRYKWWGKRDACMVPTAEERERFLG
jgi:predicted DCC family thiol-disulfide oxidoreductase YuxK